VRGVGLDARALAGTGGTDPAQEIADRLLPSGLTEKTRRTLEAEAAGADPVRLAGLILGSPEFQRR
jgi:hypothetical protein